MADNKNLLVRVEIIAEGYRDVGNGVVTIRAADGGGGAERGGTAAEARAGGRDLLGRYDVLPGEVGGQPHFATGAADREGRRRHLFYSRAERAWAVAPRCDESEGLLAVAVDEAEGWTARECVGHALARPRVPGTSLWIPVLAGGGGGGAVRREAELLLSVLTAAEADAYYGPEDGGGAAAANGPGQGDDSAHYLADLLPWEASNHEALVVARTGPERGGIRWARATDRTACGWRAAGTTALQLQQQQQQQKALEQNSVMFPLISLP